MDEDGIRQQTLALPAELRPIVDDFILDLKKIRFKNALLSESDREVAKKRFNERLLLNGYAAWIEDNSDTANIGFGITLLQVDLPRVEHYRVRCSCPFLSGHNN